MLRPSLTLITLTCSPEAELQRAQLNRIGQTHVKGASTAAAKWSCMIPEHSTQARCLLLGVDFGEGGTRTTQSKTLKSGSDRLKLDPHTIAEVGGANVEHNTNLTSPGARRRDTRIVTHLDIIPAQLELTPVIKWELVFSLGQAVSLPNGSTPLNTYYGTLPFNPH